MKRRRTAYDLSVAAKGTGVFPLTQSQAPGDGDVSITRLRLPAQFDMSGRMTVNMLDDFSTDRTVKEFLSPTENDTSDLSLPSVLVQKDVVSYAVRNELSDNMWSVPSGTTAPSTSIPSTLYDNSRSHTQLSNTDSYYLHTTNNNAATSSNPIELIFTPTNSEIVTELQMWSRRNTGNTVNDNMYPKTVEVHGYTGSTYVELGSQTISTFTAYANITPTSDNVLHDFTFNSNRTSYQKYKIVMYDTFNTTSGLTKNIVIGELNLKGFGGGQPNKALLVDGDFATSIALASGTTTWSEAGVVNEVKVWVKDNRITPSIIMDTLRVEGVLGGTATVLADLTLSSYNTSLAQTPAFHGTFNPNNTYFESYNFVFNFPAGGGGTRNGDVAEFYIIGSEGVSTTVQALEPTVTNWFTSGTISLGAIYTFTGNHYEGTRRSGTASLDETFTKKVDAQEGCKRLFMKAAYAMSTTSNRIVQLTTTATTVENTWAAELIVLVTNKGAAMVDVTVGSQRIVLVRYFDAPGYYRLNEWTPPYTYLPPGTYTLNGRDNVTHVGLVSHVSLQGVKPTLTFGERASLVMKGFKVQVQTNTLLQRRLRFPYDNGIQFIDGTATGDVRLNDVQRISVYLEPSITNHVSSHLSTGSLTMAEDVLIARTFFADDFQDDYFFSFVQEGDDLTNSATLTSNKSSAVQFTVYLDVYDMITEQFVRKPAVIPAGDFADLRMVVQS